MRTRSRPIISLLVAWTGFAVFVSDPPPASSSTFQPTTLDQVVLVSGPGSSSSGSIATDAAGNRYVVGTVSGATTFSSTVDIESGNVIDNRSLDVTTTNGSEMFIAKYADSGSLQWLAMITSDFWVQGHAIDVNPSGDIVVTGRFLGTAILSSATAASTGAPVGQVSVSAVSRSAGGAGTALGETFVARYTSNGEVEWVATASNANQYNKATSVAIDGNGNVFTTGHMWADGASVGEFRSATSAVTGQPVDQRTLSLPINTYLDVFLAKYDSSGSLQWVATAGTWAEDLSYSVDVGADGDPVIAGTFALANLAVASARRPSDGNPTPDNGTAVSANSISLPIVGFRDCFVAKYRSDGTLMWALRVGTAGEERCTAVDVGPDDRVRVAGFFDGLVTVGSATDASTGNPVSAAQVSLSSRGARDVMLASYTSAGVLEWTTNGGSTGSEDSWSLAGTPDGGVIMSSQLTGATSMSSATTAAPGTPIDATSLTLDGPTGNFGSMVARFDVEGRITWLTGVRSSTSVALQDVSVDSRGRVHGVGSLVGTIEAPPGESFPNITSAGSAALMINWGRTPRPPVIFVPPPSSTSTAPPSTTSPPTVPAPVVDRNGDLPVQRPGTGFAVEDDVEIPVEIFVEDLTDLVMRGQDFELRVTGECDNGCTIETTQDGREVITLRGKGSASVSGFGFQPGTPVYVWLFSEPRFVGELTVANDGTFLGQLELGDIAPGQHTLQVNGTSFDGANRTANLGVLVSPMEVMLPVTGAGGDTAPWLLAFLVAGVLLTCTSRRSQTLSS